MAQQTHVTLIDDIDGSPATETVRFGLDGSGYEIDLNDRNAGRLRDVLAPFTAKARKSDNRGRSGRRRARRGDVDASVVRAWAQENRVPVSERGRISASVLAQYQAATSAN